MADQMDDQTEIVLNVDGHSLTCQKNILVKGSDYFRAMFESNMIESKTNEVFIPDVDVSIMKSLIDCLITDELKIDDNVEELLAASVRFQMKTVTASCECYLVKTMDDGNCIDLMNLASSLNLSGLRSRARRHALYYFNRVISHEEFVDLDLESVIKYLSEKELNCDSELDVLQAIEKWTTHDLKERECFLPRLLACFHLEDLDKEERVSIATNTFLNNTEYGKKWIRDSCNEISENQNGSPVQKFREMPVTVLFVGERIKPDGHLSMDIWKFCKADKVMKPYTKFHCNPIGAKVVVMGKDFYLTGGQTNLQRAIFVLDVWKFDGFEMTWHKVTVLPEARRHHAACASKTKLYLLGGFGKFREVLDSVQEYDIENDSWRKLPNMLVKGYSQQADYCSEKIFLCRENTIECLDLKTECWSKIEMNSMGRDTQSTLLEIVSMIPVAYKHFIYFFKYDKFYHVTDEGNFLREEWIYGKEWMRLDTNTMEFSSYPCNKNLCFGHKSIPCKGKLYMLNYGTNTLVRTDLEDLTVFEELGTSGKDDEHCSLVVLPDYETE